MATNWKGSTVLYPSWANQAAKLVGGIGDAMLEVSPDVASRPRIVTIAVREMPTSGTPGELLEQARHRPQHITGAARALIGARSRA